MFTQPPSGAIAPPARSPPPPQPCAGKVRVGGAAIAWADVVPTQAMITSWLPSASLGTET